MKVLILNGSPRPGGSTSQLVRAFCEGLDTAGHTYDVMDVCRMDIHGCRACEYCHGKGNGACIQQDDMQKIYPLLEEAEMLVIASPIYFHGLSGQMKCTIDRCYPKLFPKGPEKLTKVAMFLCSGEPDMYDGALFSYQGDFLDYLSLQGMGVFTACERDPDSLGKALAEVRAFGAGL